MNVLATLLGGTMVVSGAVLLGVKTAQKPGELIIGSKGGRLQLKFASSRPLSSDDVGAILWSFQDYFPGVVTGIAATEPTTLLMNVALNDDVDFQIGQVGAIADIVLQLTDAWYIATDMLTPPPVPAGQVYA